MNPRLGRSVLSRILRMVCTLWLLITLVFFALHLAPGDAANTLISAGADANVIAALRAELGLDQPLWMQYVSYLGGLLRGDFGLSWRSGTSVSAQLASAFAHTLLLACAALLVASVLGIGGGVLAAFYRNGAFDVGARILALVGISAPIFVINLLGIYLFAYKYPIFPTSGARGWDSLVLPAVTLGLFVAAMMLRLVRSATLEVLGQDYVRAAYSRGIPSRSVIWQHVVPNTLITVITMLGVQFGLLLGGSVITETVFAWPGLGQMTIHAIKIQDMPIVQGAVIVFAGSFMLVNFFVDLLYPTLDPRVEASR